MDFDKHMTHGKRNGIADVCRNRRNAGFSLLELAITMAVIAIIAGMAVFGIMSARASLLADRAMYQTMTSLREARMLAMRNTDKIPVFFRADTDEIQVLMPASGWTDTDPGCGWYIEPKWVAASGNATDPSISFENGRFDTNANGMPFGEPFNDIPIGNLPNIFNSSADYDGLSTVRYLFTADGFLTDYNDHCSPRDRAIFITSPGAQAGTTLRRAVTVLGVTGRVDGWREKNGRWEKVK